MNKINNTNIKTNIKSECHKESSPKVWYDNYRGFVVKNTLCPITNRIMQEKIPYNIPIKFFLEKYNYK
jgi:hypothetical protein